MFTFDSPAIKTPSGVGSWVTLNCSEVPAGSSGAILEHYTNGASTVKGHARLKGSSLSYWDATGLQADHRWVQWVKLDSNKDCEIYVNSSDFRSYLLGYTDDKVVYIDAEPVITPASSQTWLTTDLSAYVPEGATGVIVRVTSNDGSPRTAAIRHPSSTDSRTGYNKVFGASGAAETIYLMCGINAARQIQMWWQQLNVYGYLVGYTLPGIQFFTNALNRSPSATATWEDKDISGDVIGSATHAIFDLACNSTSHYKVGVRENGISWDNIAEEKISPNCHLYSISGLDGSKIFEGYKESASGETWLVGYSGPTAQNYSELNREIAITGTITKTDLIRKIETERAISINSLLSVTNYFHYIDTHRLLNLQLPFSCISDSNWQELSLAFSIATSIVSMTGFDERSKSIPIQSYLSSSNVCRDIENLSIDGSFEIESISPWFVLELNRLIECSTEFRYLINECNKELSLILSLNDLSIYDSGVYDVNVYGDFFNDKQYHNELGREVSALTMFSRAHSIDETVKLINILAELSINDTYIKLGEGWTKILKDTGLWEEVSKDEPIH